MADSKISKNIHSSTEESLPESERPIASMQGHWPLAKVGKRVLRPGGEHLTKRMLEQTPLSHRSVVEFAPGLGRTTRLILEQSPSNYLGVDQDPQVVRIINGIVSSIGGKCILSNAARSGIESESVDAVVGEAMLTMQNDMGKEKIISEAFRILRPGGTYSIHELGLQPDNLPDATKDMIRKDLAQTIKVNARPLTTAEWKSLLKKSGFEVVWDGTAPMSLLKIQRNLADEGLVGVLRMVRNILGNADIRRRVMAMRATFNRYEKELDGVAFVARKPENV